MAPAQTQPYRPMKPLDPEPKWRRRSLLSRLPFVMAAALGLTCGVAQAQVKLLFIGGQAEPTQGADMFVMEKLQERFGADAITYKASGDSATEDADGMNGVILSSTPGSGSIRTKFLEVPIGVLNWEEALSEVARAGNFAFNDGGRQKHTVPSWNIVKNDHYITAGFPLGELQVFDPDGETWELGGDIAPSVVTLATLVDADVPTLTIAEAGTEQLGGVIAVGRRAQFPMTDNTAEFLTDEGWEMFLRAVEWIAGIDTPPGQVFDFEEEPDLEIISNTDTTQWRAAGGVDGGGYLSLTDAVGGAQANIIFPPVEDPISAFKFSVDARIGGDRDRPADGFSINIVRPEDDLLKEPRGQGYAIDHQFPQLGGLQEEGSKTGLGIGFDTWDNGQFQQEPEADIVGFSVRVDGELVHQIPAATANGEPDDETSLQTGPVGVEDPPIENLTWQRFEVELTEEKKLNITWKGKRVLEDFAVDWFPSGNMQIVFGARTGGSWEAHHFDNLSFEIVTTNTARIASVERGREGISFTYEDSEESMLVTDSVSLSIDGVEVEASVEAQGDGITQISYAPPSLWAFGSEIPWVLTAKDQNNLDVGATGTIRIASPLFPFGEPLPGPEGLDGAWASRYIWDSGTISSMSQTIERVLAAAEPGFQGEVLDVEHEVIDHGGGGFFTNDFPYPDDFANDSDGNDFIQFNKANIRIASAGDYTIGVRSDDGFGVRVLGMTFDEVHGAGRLDELSPDSFHFLGTTGNSQTRAIARNVQPGVYPIEFLWFERGGGDYGEIFAAEGAFPAEEDTDTWELIGEGLQLVAGEGPKPVIVNFESGDSLKIDFTTPNADSDHLLEMSTTLNNDWQAIADATLTPGGDLFSFAAPKPEGPNVFFRVAMLPPPPLFSEDFENGAEGWTAAGDGATQWELGTPAVANLDAANSGTNVYGTDLDGPIAGGVSASLTSPLVDVTGIGRPKLSFWYFVDTTEDEEGVQLKILSEGGDELYVHDTIFWGTSEGWTEFRLTIPEEAREQVIQIQWLLLTQSGEESGFYLDDVEVDG